MTSMDFRYSSQDFVSEIPKDAKFSRFDQELRGRWDEAVEKGFFRYELGTLTTRVIEGPHRFVAQLNEKRATDRRKPQEITSTKQPYKPEEFNFNKVRPHEILMEMHPVNLSYPSSNGITNGTISSHTEREECINGEGRGKYQVIINISPLEYGNVLLVPSPHLCQPQIATMEMIQIGVEAVLLSSTSAFRIGYNSLCAYASVNHLHMHAYYVHHRLPVEYWPTKEVVEGRVHESIGWPAQGFLLQLNKENYWNGIRDVFMIVKHLQDKDIAHNMFFTRGSTLGPNPQEDGQTVRLFLWPRISSFGIKANDAFNGACCELAGHLPIKLMQRYNDLTDEQCCELLETCSLSAGDYTALKKEIKDLFK
ncbi:GDP-D-glucose phosphorylase 1-like [Lytechinus pictus]|uniref:GDP-D-glucose phosphorylase 1-like n=1 Tax=Lytechinus pictus TaxID=7653 RepID=UPI0030BA0E98